MNNASYGKLTAGILAAWFVFAVSASSLNLFKTDPGLPPIAVGLAAFTPVAVFLLWFATSQGFREFALSLNPRTLTFVQSWRIVGFTFLVLYAAGILPGIGGGVRLLVCTWRRSRRTRRFVHQFHIQLDRDLIPDHGWHRKSFHSPPG
jgi:hypothetical protein